MAILNISNSEKTLKELLEAMPSDIYVIDRFITYCKYKYENYQIQLNNILDKYYDYFENTEGTLIKIDVPKKFYYQPAAFAENYYGTPDLDWLVLYFSKTTTLFDFNKPEIKILAKSHLVDIIRIMNEYSKDVEDSYNNPIQYIENKN